VFQNQAVSTVSIQSVTTTSDLNFTAYETDTFYTMVVITSTLPAATQTTVSATSAFPPLLGRFLDIFGAAESSPPLVIERFNISMEEA
jgi:hypothetical protein